MVPTQTKNPLRLPAWRQLKITWMDMREREDMFMPRQSADDTVVHGADSAQLFPYPLMHRATVRVLEIASLGSDRPIQSGSRLILFRHTEISCATREIVHPALRSEAVSGSNGYASSVNFLLMATNVGSYCLVDIRWTVPLAAEAACSPLSEASIDRSSGAVPRAGRPRRATSGGAFRSPRRRLQHHGNRV